MMFGLGSFNLMNEFKQASNEPNAEQLAGSSTRLQPYLIRPQDQPHPSFHHLIQSSPMIRLFETCFQNYFKIISFKSTIEDNLS